MANNINIITGAIMRKIKLRKYDKYKELRKKIKTLKKRETIEDFKDVNKFVEEITNNDVEKIKSLICQFEGKLNKGNSYTVLNISYALLISAIAIGSTIVQIYSGSPEHLQIILAMLLIIAGISALVVAFIGKGIQRNDYKDAFILKALYFKFEVLNKKSESSKEASKTNETGIGENTMSKNNELKNFCNKLCDNQANKVDYVRKKLKEEYKDNTDIYLMIKAEAQEDDGMQNLVFKVSFLALIFTSFDCIRGLLPDMGTILNSLINVVLLLAIVYLVIRIVWRDNSDSVYKWRKYILVVIDDLIEESKKSIVTDETDQIDITNEVNTENEQGN